MKPVEKETFLAEAIKVKKKLVGHPDMYVSQHIKDAHYHCLQFIKVASHNPSIFSHIFFLCPRWVSNTGGEQHTELRGAIMV